MEFLLSLLLLYVKVLAILVAILFLFFIYELNNNQGFGWLRSISSTPPLLTVLRCMIIALCGQCLIGLFYVSGFFPSFWRPRSPRKSSKPAVVLIHGLYHNASAWMLFRRRLRNAGYRNIYGLSYSSWNTTFQDIFPKVEEFVREVAMLHPDEGVVLIGHSLGGLLTRHYVSVGKHRAMLRAAVTLAAPHKGSKLSALGIGGLARSLQYQGELVRFIEASDAPAPCPCLSLRSSVDEFVLPLQSLRLELQGWEERETVPVSHAGMLFHPKPARRTVEFLEQHIT